MNIEGQFLNSFNTEPKIAGKHLKRKEIFKNKDILTMKVLIYL